VVVVRLVRGVGWVGECLEEGFKGFGMGFEDGVAEVADVGGDGGDWVGVARTGGDVEGEVNLARDVDVDDGAEDGGGVEAVEGLVEDAGGWAWIWLTRARSWPSWRSMAARLARAMDALRCLAWWRWRAVREIWC